MEEAQADLAAYLRMRGLDLDARPSLPLAR